MIKEHMMIRGSEGLWPLIFQASRPSCSFPQCRSNGSKHETMGKWAACRTSVLSKRFSSWKMIVTALIGTMSLCGLYYKYSVSVLQHNQLLTIGGLSTKVGTDNTTNKKVMGPHGCQRVWPWSGWNNQSPFTFWLFWIKKMFIFHI